MPVQRTMTVLAVILAAIVVSQEVQASDWSPDVMFKDVVDLMMANLFNIPGTIFGLSHNLGGVAEGTLVESFPCKPGPGEDHDACRNISELIRSRGFEVENYEVTTEDGYILAIQRVINPLVDLENRRKLKAVILQHGIAGISDEWVINSQYARPTPWPPEQQNSDGTDDSEADEFESEEEEDRRHPRSLAFYLANRGYDVFLPNSRGNRYSQNHVSKSVSEPSFWDFSWDELIDYDLPATIRVVQQISRKEKIPYVGWSQGSTIMFGLLAERPEYTDIIEPYIAFAPVAYMHHMRSPVRLITPMVPFVRDLNMGVASSNAFTHRLSQVCGPTEARMSTCLNFANQLYGDHSEAFDIHRLQTITHHIPAGCSFKSIAHYGQEVLSKKFARYNLGLHGNKARYGTEFPPEYNLTNIQSKSIVLFSADNDYLAAPEDVQLLVSQLGVPPMKWFNMTQEDPNWNHMDYVYHKKAGKLINPLVAEILDRFNHDSRPDVCSCKRKSG